MRRIWRIKTTEGPKVVYTLRYVGTLCPFQVEAPVVVESVVFLLTSLV